jgi:hypothetical protein
MVERPKAAVLSAAQEIPVKKTSPLPATERGILREDFIKEPRNNPGL